MPIQSSGDALKNQAFDAMLLLGAPKTGKTSFTASGTKGAPDEMYNCATPMDANDVVIVNCDAGGYKGAIDSGYRPMVADLSGVRGWAALNTALAKTIMEIKPMVDKGDVRVVSIDLGAIANEIVAFCAGDKVLGIDKIANTEISFAGADVNWTAVAAQGLSLFRAFRQLPCLVVAHAHVKGTNNNPYASKLTAGEKAQQELVKDAGSVGGDAGKLTADIAKGILTPWVHAASYIFAREVVEQNVGTPLKPQLEKRYVTNTQGNGVYQAGNRRQSVLEPVTTKSLRYILDKANSL
jgi:hypothetical protein